MQNYMASANWQIELHSHFVYYMWDCERKSLYWFCGFALCTNKLNQTFLFLLLLCVLFLPFIVVLGTHSIIEIFWFYYFFWDRYIFWLLIFSWEFEIKKILWKFNNLATKKDWKKNNTKIYIFYLKINDILKWFHWFWTVIIFIVIVVLRIHRSYSTTVRKENKLNNKWLGNG
jgi:hypothetical protein